MYLDGVVGVFVFALPTHGFGTGKPAVVSLVGGVLGRSGGQWLGPWRRCVGHVLDIEKIHQQVVDGELLLLRQPALDPVRFLVVTEFVNLLLSVSVLGRFTLSASLLLLLLSAVDVTVTLGCDRLCVVLDEDKCNCRFLIGVEL